MAADQYPCIGYDPARGNVATLEQLAKELTATSRYADEARETLVSIKQNKDIWTGGAAEKFAENIEDLPGYLDDADSSLRKAGGALEQWSEELARLKKRAGQIEADLREALEEEKRATASAQEANRQAMQSASQFSDGGASSAAAEQAGRAADNAQVAVEELRRAAETLRDQWEVLSGQCARKLSEAAEQAPSTGFWEGLGDFLAGALETIGDIAGIVSAIAGILSFVPGLNVIAAPVALVSGAVALGAHAGDFVANGKWDDPMAYVTLAGDAASMIPGVKAVKSGIGAMGDIASDGVSGVVKQFGGGAAAELTSANQLIARASGKLPGMDTASAQSAAKVFEQSGNALIQAPAIDKVAGGDNTAAHNVGGAAGAGHQVLGAVDAVAGWRK